MELTKCQILTLKHINSFSSSQKVIFDTFPEPERHIIDWGEICQGSTCMYVILIDLRSLKLVDQHSDNSYSISPKGQAILKPILEAEEKENTDHKLKLISLESVKLNKWLPLYAIVIAFLTAAVPLIIYFLEKDTTAISNTQVPQLERLIEVQDKMLQTQQNYLDSLTTLLHEVRKIRP